MRRSTRAAFDRIVNNNNWQIYILYLIVNLLCNGFIVHFCISFVGANGGFFTVIFIYVSMLEESQTEIYESLQQLIVINIYGYILERKSGRFVF